MSKFEDNMEEIFDIEPIEKTTEMITQANSEISVDTNKDYEYTRGQLYSLIEKGQEAVDGILEVATSTDHPRAYEVAGQLIKSVADATDKLMDLQKKLKDIEGEKVSKGPTTVNNALFVGSTAELSKLRKQGLLNSAEE